MNRIRIDELNGKTRIFGVAINTHEHWYTSEHNILNISTKGDIWNI